MRAAHALRTAGVCVLCRAIGALRRQVRALAKWLAVYVETAFAAKARTADHVIVHADSRATNLMDRKSLYVGMSRAKESATVFTNDRGKLVSAHQPTRRAGTTAIAQAAVPTPAAGTGWDKRVSYCPKLSLGPPSQRAHSPDTVTKTANRPHRRAAQRPQHRHPRPRVRKLLGGGGKTVLARRGQSYGRWFRLRARRRSNIGLIRTREPAMRFASNANRSSERCMASRGREP